MTCPVVVDCPGTDDPITNFSSESDDTLDFLALIWVGTGSNRVPFNQNWTATACGQSFLSTVSQLDALIQALYAAINCNYHDDHPDNGGGVHNTAQQCCFTSGSGINTVLICYTVPAGSIIALNQAQSDAWAHSIACYAVHQLTHPDIHPAPPGPNLSNIRLATCSNSFYAEQISAQNMRSPIMYSVTGTAPPGLHFDPTVIPGSLVLEGTPTTPGNYTFTVSAQDASHITVTKSYTISVLGITSGDPDDATQGTAYSFQFTASGGVGPYTFDLESGPLPGGITLDSDGLLHGTPTENGDFNITVSVTDSA